MAQLIGKEQTETHPKMTWKRCTGKGGNSCTTVNGELTIDANWRWLHIKDGYANCYDGMCHLILPLTCTDTP